MWQLGLSQAAIFQEFILGDVTDSLETHYIHH